MRDRRPRAPAWGFAASSAVGGVHAAAGTGSQDAFAVREVGTGRGSDGEAAATWCAAVADGHGGSRHPRSAEGAAMAVDIAVSAAADAVRGAERGTGLAELLRTALAATVDQWRSAVRDDAERRPLDAREAALVGRAPGSPAPLVAYGSTLLLALVTEDGVGLARLGDGEAVVRTRSGLRRPPGDERLAAGATTSLCLPDAEDDVRYAVVPREQDPDLVLLASDGYGNAFAVDDWSPAVLDDVANLLTGSGSGSGPGFVAERLPDWLRESAAAGGDDVTVVLLFTVPLRSAGGPQRGARLTGSSAPRP